MSRQPYEDRPFDPAKIEDPNFAIPDMAEAVEGWRAWGVPATPPPFGTPPKLKSVTHGDYYWVPRQTAMAYCRNCGDDVPGESCTCGFYSANTLEHLMSMSYHWYDAESSGCFHVVGQVANWGKVIPGTQGWRAQYSYPVALFVPFEAYKLAKPLSEAYGIPVKLQNILKPQEPREE